MDPLKIVHGKYQRNRNVKKSEKFKKRREQAEKGRLPKMQLNLSTNNINLFEF